MSDIVQELETHLHDQPRNPLRHEQQRDWQEELARLDAIMKAPPWQGGDRGAAGRRHRELSRLYDAQVAKPIPEASRRDKVARLCKEVLAEKIRPAMLTREEMRRNPAGAVDRNLRQEASAKVKRAILTWKRGMRALDPENEDRDYTNLERFRPELTTAGQPASFMPGAQIPGHFAQSPLAKENWPAGMPEQGTVNSPLKQVQEREKSEKRRKLNLSPEQRQALGQRLAAARAAKAAVAAQEG